MAGGVLIAWMAASRMLSGATFVFDSWPAPDFAQQFPPARENDSATRLLATAERLGDLYEARGALGDYIRQALTAAEPQAPPPSVAQILESRANVIRTLRAQVISNPPPFWSMSIDDILDPPQPPLSLHMRIFALLTADALAEHSHQDEAAAWSDLRAEWVLARSLWQRPEIFSVMTGLAGSRMVAAAAAKLDPPVPAWWEEAASFATRPPLIQAIEYEAWAARERADRYPAGEPGDSRFADAVRSIMAPVLRPIRAVQASLTVGDLREVAYAAANADACDPFVSARMPEWSGAVRRFHRFEIEREGAAKFLELRAGRRPSPTSVCREGRWDVGATELAFHGPAPPPFPRWGSNLRFSVPSTSGGKK